MKAQWDEECCWEITQSAEPSCCVWSGFSVLAFGFQLDSLLYAYAVNHVFTQFLLAENSTCSPDAPECNCCVNRGASVLKLLITKYHKRVKFFTVPWEWILFWTIDRLENRTGVQGTLVLSLTFAIMFFFHGSTALVGLGLLIVEVSRSHAGTP